MTDAPDAVPVTDAEPDATSSQVETKPKRRFRMSCLGCCACVFFLFVFLCIGVKVWMVVALNSRVAALRAAGEPTTWAEVVADYGPVPDEENMELLLEPLLDRGSSVLDTPTGAIVCYHLHTPFGMRPSTEACELLRSFLKENEAGLVLVHRAVARPDARWPLVAASDPLKCFQESAGWNVSPCLWASGYYLALWYRHDATRMLIGEVAAHAAEGDSQKVAQAVLALRRIAASIGQYPHLLAQDARMEYARLACSSVEDALSQLDFSVENLAMLQKEFEAEADQLDLHSAVRAARAGSLWLATEGRGFFFKIRRSERMGKVLGAIPGVVESEALCGLNYTTQWLAVLDLDPREQLVRMDALDERLIPEYDEMLETP